MWKRRDRQGNDIVIDHPASEASGLLAIRNRAVLEAQGWDDGYWTCSDEDPVERALGALGRNAATGEWEFCRVAGARGTTKKKTEDSEGMARRGDWVYLFGSHYGAKTGRLRPRRSFVARFNEARIEGKLDDAKIDVEIARGAFKLHRLLNDAFKESGLAMIEHGAEEATECIRKTRRHGEDRKKSWAGRIHDDDWPINIEGVAFRSSGALLVGLRYPVTRDGHPILVELDDVDKLFRDPPDLPSILHLWVLENVGSAREPRGVRGLEEEGDAFHVITGSLDSTPEESVLLHDHPEGARAESHHHRFTLPAVSLWTGIKAELIEKLEGEQKIEGIAADTEGDFSYVVDDDAIRLRPA
jgi:hypothetical protein